MIKSKDLISVRDLSLNEIKEILNLALGLKNNKVKDVELKGKTLGLVFQKPSNRTRVSFTVAMNQLKGYSIYLAPDELQLGERESVKDAAKVLSRYLDVIAARTYAHDTILELAKEASVPVINALTDLLHPCQALSDIFTIQEIKGNFKKVKLAYIGDGNNVLHSLLFAASKVGLDLSIGAPEGYGPDENILKEAKNISQKTGSEVQLTYEPIEAVKDADFVYTDVWASMHQEEELEKRKKIFKSYQINKKLLSYAKKDCLVMHCLPAKRGTEITDEVLDGKQSIVYQQAENRLHIEKAILVLLLNNEGTLK